MNDFGGLIIFLLLPFIGFCIWGLIASHNQELGKTTKDMQKVTIIIQKREKKEE